MAKKFDSGSALSLGALALVAVAAFKYLPSMLRSSSAPGGGATGGVSSNPVSRFLHALAAPLPAGAPIIARATPQPVTPNRPKPSVPLPDAPKAPPHPPLMGAGSSGGAAPVKAGPRPVSGGGGTESVSQALANGDYNAWDQNLLAGIWNVQQGAGDFAGDSRASISDTWLTGNNSLDSSGVSASVDSYFPSQSFDYMSNIPTQDIPGGSGGGNNGAYSEPVLYSGNYPTDTGSYSSDYQNTDYTAYGPNGAMSYA